MGVLRGTSGGGFVGGSDRFLAFTRAVGARVGRGLRQVGEVVVERDRVCGSGGGGSIGVAKGARARPGRRRAFGTGWRVLQSCRGTTRRHARW
jgi:hypothetical protein